MTVSLPDILTQLRGRDWQFNPPATDAELAHLAAALNCTLDELLSARIYHDHNGTQPHFENMFMMRLMPVEEVIATYRLFEEFESLHPDRVAPSEARFLWSDDDSNYVGLYVSGALAGKLCLYNHDDPDFAPRFRSIESFYEHSLRFLTSITVPEDAPAFYDMPSDYPLLADAPETDAADFTLALEFLAEYQAISARNYKNRRHRHFLSFTVMNLIPFSQSEKLLPLTHAKHDEDAWIQDYACELLGKRRYLPAIPRLKAIALNGRYHRAKAIRALGWMRSPEAKAALLEILPHFADDPYFVEWALREVYQPDRIKKPCAIYNPWEA